MKNYNQLTAEQRIIISFLLKKNKSQNYIAKELGVHPSTICRELKRNKTSKGRYNYNLAESFAQDRKVSKKRYMKLTEDLKSFIERKIKKRWSPEQITGYCRANSVPMVSHERIYQYVYQDKQNGGDLWTYLRTKVKHRKSRTRKRQNRFIANKRMLSERPQIVDEKSRFGDWEIDLISGKGHKSFAVTAVERKSGFSLIQKIDNKKSSTVKKAVINLLAPYRENVYTITSDNGLEFAEHQTISSKLEADYFFCDPYSSWQRGLNEYTNKLYRQYIPKKTCIKTIEYKDLISYQTALNNRPRKKLGYKTPSEVFLSIFDY
ncbi:IS30 family transposase [Elizabethkingia anophelis]|nr:IS30 family transposase [Elizabethkingia anophelis]MDV3729916.1 IS30 family transposase [Elizabethkingia anophelis]MDV3744747.1 IS30 family transposase [Elizabethkingia anophelis]